MQFIVGQTDDGEVVMLPLQNTATIIHQKGGDAITQVSSGGYLKMASWCVYQDWNSAHSGYQKLCGKYDAKKA